MAGLPFWSIFGSTFFLRYRPQTGGEGGFVTCRVCFTTYTGVVRTLLPRGNTVSRFLFSHPFLIVQPCSTLCCTSVGQPSCACFFGGVVVVVDRRQEPAVLRLENI